MSWLTGAYDEQGIWKPHSGNSEEDIVEGSTAEKEIAVQPLTSAAKNVLLFTPSPSNDSSVYIREYRITLTTSNDGDENNKNNDRNFEGPYDERYW